ncbi:hypothetical protein JYQ62_15150 [Nostoc sp. UHCC 0702]|nr:hypothetical protein JYQ62_15150 [Nostoc sp. UHCC 0702]
MNTTSYQAHVYLFCTKFAKIIIGGLTHTGTNSWRSWRLLLPDTTRLRSDPLQRRFN